MPSFIYGWSLRDKQFRQLDMRSLKLLSKSANDSGKNLILDRFLADQAPFICAARAELRNDLKVLPRAGQPASSPTVSSLSSYTVPSFTSTNDVTGCQDEGCRQDQNSVLKLMDIPGLRFADYMWAISASQKMKIEAIYI